MQERGRALPGRAGAWCPMRSRGQSRGRGYINARQPSSLNLAALHLVRGPGLDTAARPPVRVDVRGLARVGRHDIWGVPLAVLRLAVGQTTRDEITCEDRNVDSLLETMSAEAGSHWIGDGSEPTPGMDRNRRRVTVLMSEGVCIHVITGSHVITRIRGRAAFVLAMPASLSLFLLSPAGGGSARRSLLPPPLSRRNYRSVSDPPPHTHTRTTPDPHPPTLLHPSATLRLRAAIGLYGFREAIEMFAVLYLFCSIPARLSGFAPTARCRPSSPESPPHISHWTGVWPGRVCTGVRPVACGQDGRVPPSLPLPPSPSLPPSLPRPLSLRHARPTAPPLRAVCVLPARFGPVPRHTSRPGSARAPALPSPI